MDKEIILTPEELYYLGSFLQAKYIDYAYVAAMNDIGQNYSLFEKETKASLVSSGIFMEDFSGNLEISATASTLLKPIFFGEKETSIDICEIGETNKVIVHKLHFCDGTITMVSGHQGKLIIKSVDNIAVDNIIADILPENYENSTNCVLFSLEKEKVTRVIALKSIKVGVTAEIKVYIEAEGILYQEVEEKIESVTKAQFISDASNIVKGV